MVVKVLFVCTGNICRSPSAEGMFRELVAQESLVNRIDIASAGTHGWHVGNPPDPRSVAAAARRQVDISGQRARQFQVVDFDDYDYVIAMDHENERFLRPLHGGQVRARLALFMEFAPGLNVAQVPDPYYGEGDGFETVLDMIEVASAGLLGHIKTSGQLEIGKVEKT